MQLQGAESATTSGASPSAVYFEQISALVDKQIPEQAKSLADNATNLEKVAQYCEDIYVNSKDADKQHLLNETKGYTTQALASVAYQIHVLANSFLLLLDNQTEILNNMNVSVAHFAHEVNIHKEKVARREIGILTTNKNVTRTVKVKKPEIEEKPVKYVRRPVDYSILDDVGHGVKLTRHSDPLSKLGVQTVGRQNSYSSTHSSSNQPGNTTSSSQLDGVPMGQHTPPMLLKSGGAGGTVRSAASLMQQQQQQQLQHQQSTVSTASGGGIYRAPVVPPSVPSEYLSRQELGIYSSKKELNQSLASAGGDTSLGGAYGGMSYRRPSQSSTNNMSLNMGGGEYSDTMDRRMAATYMQQFGVYNPGVNPAAHLMASNNGNSSVGYASGKDLGLIRTNLNNIDYATNGTIYRRPQLSSMIYEQQRQNSTGIPQPPPQPPSQQQSNTSLYGPGRMSSGGGGGGGGGGGLPPPPPPPMPASLLSQQSAYEASPPQPPPPPPPALPQAPPPNSGGFLASSHEFDDVDADLIDDDDDHEVIPNWVPINRCLEKVITTFDYEGQRDDELSFKENMFIYVIKKNDDHWYEGIMKTQMGNVISGLYPYNYARTVKRYVDDPRITQC